MLPNRDGTDAGGADAWAQRALPFESPDTAARPLTEQALAHRRQMLEYLTATSRAANRA
jgi:hypothetical protein